MRPDPRDEARSDTAAPDYPHDLDAERAVLGAVLIRPEGFFDVDLSPPMFYRRAHQILWARFHTFARVETPIDISILLADLTNSGDLEIVGGAAYVAGLSDGVARSTNIKHYAEIVRERWRRRALMEAAAALIEDARLGEEDPSTLAASAMRRLDAAVGTRDEDVVGLDQLAEALVGDIDPALAFGTAGVPVPYESIAALCPTLRPGNVIVIGARPGMGKTALALSLADRVAEGGRRVLFFSYEMPAEELWQRAVAQAARVPGRRLTRGMLSEANEVAIVEAVVALRERPLKLASASGWRLSDVVRTVTVAQRTGGVDLVVVDYLQLVEPERRSESREREVAEISRGFKKMAVRLGVPVVVLSQLSRKAEERNDKRPTLADLRESGAIEQDADVVWLLWQNERARIAEGVLTEIIVAKQRNGPTGIAKLAFIKQWTGFEDVREDHDPAAF